MNSWLRRLYLGVRAPVRPSRFVRPTPSVHEAVKIARGLRFRDAQAPVVSIVVPTYGKLEFTVACLRSIAEHTDGPDYEVIVVDDASKDRTVEVLERVEGLRLVRNAVNLGFIGTCNAGAAAARGEYLVFLNNDTQVEPGWMRELHRVLAEDPDVGLVGSKLIYPSGALQEAGGLVFRDGSAANYGRLDDPRKPQYEYLRETDYCSGASVMLRASFFRELGGFDAHFAPAYYEDTDLAFRVRKAGRKVVYQPRSEVIHFEGVTSGTDTSSGIKRYQVLNAEKFEDRWRAELALQSSPGTPHEHAKDRGAARRLLIVDSFWPTSDRDSGSVRMENLIRIWQGAGFTVTFVAVDHPESSEYSDRLERNGVEAERAPYFISVRDHLRLYGGRYDVVQLVRGAVAGRCLPDVRRFAPRARVIFDTVDLHFLRAFREANLTGDRKLARQARSEKRLELGLVRSVDVTFVVSDAERGILEREAPGKAVLVVSNIHPRRSDIVTREGRDAMCFIGTYGHPPNLDAARFLVEKILPRVRIDLPGVKLLLIGPDPPESLRALATEGVTLTGNVPDLAPLLAKCRLSVAPLRFGAGVKGKLNTSMSYGVPVVATPLAAEGMHLEDGRDVLLASDADGIASAIVRLFRDDALWTELSKNGRSNVERHFSFERARATIDEFVRGLPGPVGVAHGVGVAPHGR